MNKSILEENIAFVGEALLFAFERRGRPLPSPDLVAKTNAHLQNLVDAARISRYDEQENVEKIVASGRFKAILERDAARIAQGRPHIIGPDYNQMRRDAERYLFGITDGETEGRPIYGVAANGTNRAAETYGKYQFVFRDAVRSVATMTAGDTLIRWSLYPGVVPRDALITPVFLNNVTIEGIAEFIAFSGNDIESVLRCATLDELRAMFGADYFEAQLHGNVGVEQVESLLVKQGIILPRHIRQWAESHQIQTGIFR